MSPFFAFQWHITEACDQRCRHCYIFAEDPQKIVQSMQPNEMEKVLNNIAGFCAAYDRTPYLYITGGDPLLHPYFWKLMEMVKKRQLPFAILGNPFHLNDEVCKRLKECGCDKYQLSVDGMRNTHDWFRIQGSFDETLNKITTIRKAGIKAVVMTTVSEINIAEVPAVIDAVVSNKADVYAFARYVPTGKGKSTAIKPVEYRHLLEICDKKFLEYEKDRGCVTHFNRKDHLWTLYEYEEGRFHIPADSKSNIIYGGCNCGNCHLSILPNGDVYACRRVSDSKVGNVLHDRLSEIWVNEMEQYRSYTKFTKCSRCELLAWCRGCPAVAKGTYGSFYDEDPQCWKTLSFEKESAKKQ